MTFLRRNVLAPLAYAAAAFPLALAAAPMALLGQADRVAAAQVRLAERFGPAGHRGARPGAGRVVVHGVATLLPSLVAFGAVGLTVFLTWSGWLYPVRPDTIGALGHPFTADPILDNAWGGPTLIGAWLVHAMVALGLQVICLAVIRALNGYHGRLLGKAV